MSYVDRSLPLQVDEILPAHDEERTIILKVSIAASVVNIAVRPLGQTQHQLKSLAPYLERV